MIQSPSNLELLLHCYYSPEVHPRFHAPAIQEGIRYLRAVGMIEPDLPIGTKVFNATDKGVAFIQHLMTVPFPVQKWEISFT